MPLIYITGPTGAGKSTVCQALRSRGFKAHDTDDEGMRNTQTVGDKQLLTLDAEVVRRIYDKSAGNLVFICGTSPTDLDSRNLFSKIILLEVREAEQRQRITHRTNSTYGKDPHQLAKALRWRQAQIDRYRNGGAITIDATQPINEIVQQILRST